MTNIIKFTIRSLHVSVHAAQEEVHAEIGDQHAQKGDDGKGVEYGRAVQGRKGFVVQGERID